GEHNVDFHPTMDFIEASPLRIVPFFDTMLVQQGEDSGIPTEPHHTPSLEAPSPSHTIHTLPSLPPVTTTSIPTVTLTEITPIRQYTRRARIAQSSALPTVADEPAPPQRAVSQWEAYPTDSGFIADQDRATIAKSSTLPYDSAPWVTSPVAVEGSMQQTIPELTALCTSLQRQLSELTDKFQAQDVEINRLKERVKLLEKREGLAAKSSGDDAPIKGRSMDEGEEATERISDDSEEMETILTSMDAATVLASRVIDVPTGSESIPTASTPVEGSVPTGSEEVPTASPFFATATVIDAQVARELKEQLEREDPRRAEQIARDAEVARIHVEEELQSMIDGLDSNNETIAKYLQEYHQFSSELHIERRVELISDLVKYEDNYTKIYKFQRWKVKDFRGMTFKEVKAKFNSVWKQMEDFIPMGSKEEAEKIKRKGLNLEQESAKKQKTSEEVSKEAMSPEEVTKEKVKEMMQLVPIEEVYAKALQVKHPIIDWKVYTEGQMSYWKITRLGGSSASYQFFIDLLKHQDMEDLNQLWRLVKETLSNRPPTSEKEMELWVELNRIVHHVTSKDKEIYMLVEKDYPLRKGLAFVMICYKLQMENFSQMANDLVLKIYKITNSPRQQALRFIVILVQSVHSRNLHEKHPEEYYDLIENMTAYHNDWDTSAQLSESSSSITSSSDTEIAAPKAKMAKINKNIMRVLQVNQQVKAVTPNYETCGGPHSFSDCPATVGNTQNVYAVGAYQVVAPIIEPVASLVITLRPKQRSSISYPSRFQDQKLCDKANDQREKIFQMFKDLNFNISFADALILMPKFGSSIKSLLTNKDKLYHGFVGYPFDYRVPLGFSSIAGGLDHVNPIIRLPIEHGIYSDTMCTGYYIRLTRMVANFAVIIVEKLYPTTLMHIQLFLIEDMPETLMVGVYDVLHLVQVMSPDLEGKYYRTQFQIMGGVILLVNFNCRESYAITLPLCKPDAS
nr:reverse transcriptase domain-containing protein [Tanacetum cinerariifolium]